MSGKVKVVGVTGGYALKDGTWTVSGDTLTADGPAKLCLIMECGTVEVDVPEGKHVTITINGTEATIEFS